MKLSKWFTMSWIISSVLAGSVFADDVLMQVRAAKQEALQLYNHLSQIELSLEAVPQQTQFADTQTVPYIVNIQCVQDSPRDEVKNAISIAEQNARTKCEASYDPARCVGNPILEFHNGTGSDAFTCYVTATLMIRQ